MRLQRSARVGDQDKQEKKPKENKAEQAEIMIFQWSTINGALTMTQGKT